MLVTYNPGPGERQQWQFNPEDVKASQAELIEKRFGGGYAEWSNEVRKGSIRARRVLLWHLLRTESGHHTLRFEDTPDFTLRELVVEMSVAELVELRDRLAKVNMPEDEREQVAAALDIEISEAMAREDASTNEPLPKAV